MICAAALDAVLLLVAAFGAWSGSSYLCQPDPMAPFGQIVRNDGNDKPQYCSDYDTGNNDGSKTVWQRTTGDPVAFFTFVLAVFTAILSIVSIAQGYFLFRADNTARKAAEAASLTARNILRTNRPLCIMENIILSPFSGLVPDVSLPPGYRLMSIYGIIKNKGNGAAFARESQFSSRISPDIGEVITPESEADVFFGYGELGPGETYSPDYPMYPLPISDEELSKEGWKLYVKGWLRYADVHGVIRRSGFAFVWVPGFVQIAEDRFIRCGPSAHWYDVEEE